MYHRVPTLTLQEGFFLVLFFPSLLLTNNSYLSSLGPNPLSFLSRFFIPQQQHHHRQRLHFQLLVHLTASRLLLGPTDAVDLPFFSLNPHPEITDLPINLCSSPLLDSVETSNLLASCTFPRSIVNPLHR